MFIETSFETAVGLFQVVHDGSVIHRSYFSESLRQTLDNHPLTEQITQWLAAYFKNPQQTPQLPLNTAKGSTFQQNVWQQLLTIPSGQTLSYGDLASALNTSPRAIGQACKSNPLPLFIPCHRVVGKKQLGGYMGKADRLQYKISLLRHEGGLRS